MNSEMPELRAAAQVLLAQFEEHLHEHGGELAELRAAGVGPTQLAALYEADETTWRLGIMHMLKVEPVQKVNSAGIYWEPTRLAEHLPPLTSGALANAQSLARILRCDAPVLTAKAREIFELLSTRELTGDYTGLLLLLLLLHTLATSPSAPAILAASAAARFLAQRTLACCRELVPHLPAPEQLAA